MINTTQKLLPVPSLRRSGLRLNGLTPKFIVCHDTGNDGSSASGNVDYYIKSANDMQASAHAFVDDKGVIECIPALEKAWHVVYGSTVDNKMFGFDANDEALAVELCFSTKGFFDSKIAYANYVEYIKGLCAKYALDPRTKLVAHGTLDPARRTDPFTAFATIGKTWQNFIDDVVGACPPEEMISVLVPKSKVEKIKKIIEII